MNAAAARIDGVMSRRVVTIEPATRVRVAEWVMLRSGTRYLPVMEEERLVGVVSEHDLARAAIDDAVATCMSGEVLAIGPRTTIAEAAAQMNHHAIGCLPVVAGEALVGIVTRADLRRAGLDEEEVAEPRCVSCGGAEQVRPDPRTAAVAFCAECLDRALDDVELGGSD